LSSLSQLDLSHTHSSFLSLDFHFFVCVCRSYTYENGVTQFGGWPPPVSFFSQPRQPGVVRFSFCFFFVSVGIKMRCRQHNLVSMFRCYRYPPCWLAVLASALNGHRSDGHPLFKLPGQQQYTLGTHRRGC
jgi:hypothetical protein